MTRHLRLLGTIAWIGLMLLVLYSISITTQDINKVLSEGKACCSAKVCTMHHQ